MGKKLEHILRHSEISITILESGRIVVRPELVLQLLEILKMKFVLIAFLVTVLVSSSMSQSDPLRLSRDLKVDSNILEEVRDLDAGAEISLNNLEERDRDECDTGSFCKSDRDCKGMYSSCHTNGHPGFNNLCCT